MSETDLVRKLDIFRHTKGTDGYPVIISHVIRAIGADFFLSEPQQCPRRCWSRRLEASPSRRFCRSSKQVTTNKGPGGDTLHFGSGRCPWLKQYDYIQAPTTLCSACSSFIITPCKGTICRFDPQRSLEPAVINICTNHETMTTLDSDEPAT